jgi:hypothetical protein
VGMRTTKTMRAIVKAMAGGARLMRRDERVRLEGPKPLGKPAAKLDILFNRRTVTGMVCRYLIERRESAIAGPVVFYKLTDKGRRIAAKPSK